jgi:hypothetical protein
MYVCTTLVVRLWRERKRKREEEAIKMAQNKNNGKFRKEATSYPVNAIGLPNRRIIREVPALKFFDEQDESLPPSNAALPPSKIPNPSVSPPQLDGITPLMSEGTKSADRHTPSSIILGIPERVASPPRGVCYRMDEAGFRKIKMHSTTLRLNRNNKEETKKETITIEKAMGKNIYRK